MSANTRRSGSGMPGRKTMAGVAGFGSAAALAGAGMAMLASPGAVAPADGLAHSAQPGVQTAALTATIKSRSATPPQPVLPQSDPTNAANVTPPPDPPGNLVNPAAQPNNPAVGFQGNVILPLSPDGGFGTPSASATAKVDLPSLLFGNPAGGSASLTVTSSQAGNWVSNFLGFLPTPQQLDLGSSVQASRDNSGNLPSSLTGSLGSQPSAGMNQNAADAFNALFGPGGPAANIQNITEALLPQPVPLVNLFDPVDAAGGLNMLTSPEAPTPPPVPTLNLFDPVNAAGGLNTLNSNPLPTDNGTTFADRFSAVTPGQPDPFNFLTMSGNPPAPAASANPAAAGPVVNAPASDTLTPPPSPASDTANVLGSAAAPGFGDSPSSGVLPPAQDPPPASFQQASASDPSVTVATGGVGIGGFYGGGGYDFG